MRVQDALSRKIHYQLATIADLDLLLKFVQEFHKYENLPFDTESDRDTLLHFLSHETLGQAWLILCAGEVIGYIVLTLGFNLEYRGQDVFIDEFYLRPQYRGQGIGTQTLAFAQDACQSMGIQAMHLEVNFDNSHAQRLYRRSGYQDHDRFLMTKKLGH
jgi:GNAT superfamily N-acetyltransferase